MRILIHSNNNENSLIVKEKLNKLISDSELELVTTDPELIVVIGGDGTMLSAIRKFKYKKLSFIGINTGTLGFLPSLVPDDIDDFVDMIKNKEYREVEYPMLKLTCETIDGRKVSHYAFNDILIKHLQPQLMEAKIYFNDKPFNYFTGDGFIISTPVGATGYGIWAGGAATHTSLDIYQIIPLNPNDNSVNRPLKTPMIVPTDTKLTIEIVEAQRKKVIVACDGKTPSNNYVYRMSVRVSEHHKIKVLRATNCDYFDLYKNKIIDKKIIKML